MNRIFLSLKLSEYYYYYNLFCKYNVLVKQIIDSHQVVHSIIEISIYGILIDKGFQSIMYLTGVKRWKSIN